MKHKYMFNILSTKWPIKTIKNGGNSKRQLRAGGSLTLFPFIWKGKNLLGDFATPRKKVSYNIFHSSDDRVESPTYVIRLIG